MNIVYALLYNNRLYSGQVKEGQEVRFGSHKKDHVDIENMNHTQLVIKNKKADIAISSKSPFTLNLKKTPIAKIIHLGEGIHAALYIDEASGIYGDKLQIPYNAVFSLGRKSNNDIIINLPFISGSHCVIRSEAGKIRIEDKNSTNGIFVNGHRVSKAELVKSGDVISTLTFSMRILNGEVLFENTHNQVVINRSSQNSLFDNSSYLLSENKSLTYKRSPRIQEKLPSEDIILASPPSKGQKVEKGRGMVSSIAGSGAMMLSSLAMGMASPALFAARAAGMVVSPITNAVSSTGGNKKRKKKAEEYERLRIEKYGAYIASEKARIETISSVQREIISRENPNINDCADIVFGLKRNLWERTSGDRDFLDVRIGMGYENLCVNVKGRTDANSFQMESDEVKELSERIIEETRIVDNVPKRVSLRNYNTIGLIGSRQKVIKLIKNMLVSLTAMHCYEDVKIIGIFDESERGEWESVKWLPHIWDENKQFRYLAFNKDDTKNLCELFCDILKKRREDIKDTYLNVSAPKPHYIFIFGSKSLIEKENLMTELFYNNAQMGMTSLFLFNDIYSLPHECRLIIDVDNSPSPCCFERNKANEKEFFTLDNSIDFATFDSYARYMSAINLEGFTTVEPLPNGITFLQGYGCDNVNGLNVIDRWRNSTPYKSLAAPIGVMNAEKQFLFDIHEKAHGPHGLVAGTTGSGKSELLQTWILSMALSYHPYDVNFVIIDYKGGGMANLLEPLPHVVGKITNISSNISRSLISLQSEVQRRLKIFDKYGVNHIDKYQRLHKMGNADEPLPHLIIVADEFAELKKAEPEFMAGLISVSRVGRSLGIHLVLATQKPGGVVDDQIQSNSRFRLCLKVQDVTDSREMIKRPDAAKITQAGRAFVRVGEDEYFDIFQSYWSGAPYFGTTLDSNDVGNQVRYVEINGQRIKTVQDEKTRFKSDVDELNAIVRYIVNIAKKNEIQKLNGPWLPELPDNIILDDLIPNGFDGKGWSNNKSRLRTTVGLFDNPQYQSQGPIEMDFSSQGNYAVYGAPSTGKTTFLKTLTMSLCRTFSPEEVSIYIIDCGGWSMSVFANMPHVGGVALDCESEKVLKLEQLILEEIDRRKRVFYSCAVSSFEAYHQTENQKLPAFFILVDNIISMFDLYPDLENTFITLSREGSTYGIYLVYTASNTTGVRYKVMQNVKGAIAFELNDKGDYAAVVGRVDGLSLPKIIGRGLAKGNPPLEFQAAMYAHGESEQKRVENVKRIAAEMNSNWKGEKASPIPVMPEHVNLQDAISEYSIMNIIPLGMNYDDIKLSCVDLSDNYSFVVSGGISSGKSEYLSILSNLILNKFSDSKIYVFDCIKKSLSKLQDKVYKYSNVSDEEHVTEMISEIIEHLNQRKRAQNQARQADISSFDEKNFILNYEMITIVIDDLKEFVDTVSDNNKNSMERICRLAQNLGVIVIASGRTSDLIRYNEIESLTRVIIGNQNGIGLSDTPAMYSFFQNNLKYNEKDIEVGEGNGYLFVNGKCKKIKLLEE